MRSACDNVDYDINITANCLRVHAHLTCLIHQGLSDIQVHTWQADVKADFEKVSTVSQAEIDLGLNDKGVGEDDPPSAGRKRDGAF